MVEGTLEVKIHQNLGKSGKFLGPKALLIYIISMLLSLISPYQNPIVLKIIKTTMFGHL
jgi:hypothetical protein